MSFFFDLLWLLLPAGGFGRQRAHYKPASPQIDYRVMMMISAPCACCSFCGGNLAGAQRRLFNQAKFRKFVVDKCKEAPFIYPILAREEAEAVQAASSSQPSKQYLCIPCVNWRRRAESGRLRRQKQPMLQLDQMLLFLLQPGRFPEPDHRCMDRLVTAVRQPENLYRPYFPSPIVWIVDHIEGNTFQHCVAAWWKYNHKTAFFASPHEAKRVRCAVKNGLVEE